MRKNKQRIQRLRSAIQIVSACFIVLGFAGTATRIVTRSQAATPFLAAETEAGTLIAPATSVVDTTASAGKALKFGQAAVTNPSGEAMPIGDLPGWKQNLAEDFKTNATPAQFDATYANSWCGYADGTGTLYYKSAVSAVGGLQVYTLDGVRGAAGSYGPPTTCWGGLYGRYSIRFKATAAAGQGTAMMLWPSSNVWSDGEIDYPEGNFDGTLHVYHHPTPCDMNDTVPPAHCGSSDNLDTGKSWYQWHTATTEWLPGSVKYYLDGSLIKTVTHDIPATNHRWTLQVAPNGGTQPGKLEVDWVASWTKI